jgi:Fe-S cluster biogenesis protein NfuA
MASDPREAADRVDRLLEQLRRGPDPRAGALAEELVGCLVQLYGAGLRRVVELVGPQGSHELCADPLVESLLLVHDLHPLDADTRIRRALRTFGEADLLGVDADGVAHVRLGGGGGCHRSSARAAVESAIREAAPEVTGVVVEVTAEPPLLQITRRPVGAP